MLVELQSHEVSLMKVFEAKGAFVALRSFSLLPEPCTELIWGYLMLLKPKCAPQSSEH